MAGDAEVDEFEVETGVITEERVTNLFIVVAVKGAELFKPIINKFILLVVLISLRLLTMLLTIDFDISQFSPVYDEEQLQTGLFVLEIVHVPLFKQYEGVHLSFLNIIT